MAKWLSAERTNEETNLRLNHTCEEFNILPHITWREFVSFARKLTESIIGPLPTWDSVFGIFSGGASTSRPRTASHPALKYIGKADITAHARPLFEQMLEEMPVWAGLFDLSDLREVEGNVMFVVPKNADIDRCACKEPDINMFIQKGLGGAIRHGLKRVGIDLNDQSRNQQLAREGSINGLLSTLDLSSASDSVTYGLVELLMPDIWFSYLNMVRSPVTDVFGEQHRNEMFSSMGNGFTFELESLLFYVLARTTAYFRGVSGVISIYGDDIIVPVDLTHDLRWVLSYFGFTVNSEKSFWEGPFRESCGGHYYNGLDVTPFYVKGPVRDLQGLIHLGNAVRKWASRNVDIIVDDLVYDLWCRIRDLVPKRFWGGRDLDSKEALVSADLPNRRLVPDPGKKISTGDGGYLLWLNATMARTRETGDVQTSLRSRDTGKFRVRPNHTPYFTLHSPFFLEELGCVPV